MGGFMIDMILDIVSPSRCVACGRPVGSMQYDICRSCFGKIAKIQNGCPVCSGSFEDGYCGICSERAFYPKKNIAIAEYSGIMRILLQKLKFNGMKRLHVPIALLVLDELSRHDVTADIITCVPMNGHKKWKRGFNQSELIAKLISKRSNIPFCRLLKEKPRAATQRELGQRHRFINVINRYDVIGGKDIKGSAILIIDDVFTTGATINECSRVLLKAGASDVYAITVARSNVKRLENP
jgi:competence protein ComFC